MLHYYSIIIIIFVFTGLFAVAWYARKIMRADKSKQWPKTEATISYAENDPSLSYPMIHYEYEISGKQFNKLVEPSPEEVTMPGFDKYFIKQYPEGGSLTVFYDEKNPEITTLTPGAKTEDKIILGLCVSAVLLGVYALTI